MPWSLICAVEFQRHALCRVSRRFQSRSSARMKCCERIYSTYFILAPFHTHSLPSPFKVSSLAQHSLNQRGTEKPSTLIPPHLQACLAAWSSHLLQPPCRQESRDSASQVLYKANNHTLHLPASVSHQRPSKMVLFIYFFATENVGGVRSSCFNANVYNYYIK